MEWSTQILGRGVVHALQVRSTDALVTIGADRFSRKDLAAVECFNFVAAARLSEVIKVLGPKHTRDLFHHFEPEQVAGPGIGAFAFAVIGACFEHKHVGTLAEWVEHTRQKNEKITTFLTMKNNIDKHTSRTAVRHHSNGGSTMRERAHAK